MSSTEALRFLGKLQQDPGLLEEILGGGRNLTERITAMVRAGADRGLDFTAAEVRNAFAAVGPGESGAELSASQLESVAGGSYQPTQISRLWTLLETGVDRASIGETEKNLSIRRSLDEKG
jgi:hypothetical protein